MRNINEFSVIINTTSYDLKVIITELLEEVLGILASSETKVDIVTLEDVERDPETFQTRLYQRCL